MSIYMTQTLQRSLQLSPQTIATVFGDRRRNYSEFASRVARLAAALQTLGMRAEDRVGMMALNSDRYLEYYYGVWWGGGTVNPVNIRWSVKEVAYSLDDCDTAILIVDDTFKGHVPALKEASRALRTVIYAGEGECPDGMLSYEDLIAGAAPVADARRSGDDLAGIFYTGGTTGFPKGVMLTHTNLNASAMTLLTEGLAESGSRQLVVAPMFHMAAGAFMFAHALTSSTYVIAPSFTVDVTLRLIQDERVTHVLLVPTMIQMVVDHPALAQYDLGSLRSIAYGASTISEAVLKRAIERIPGAGFMQAYGMTELSPVCSILPTWHHTPEGQTAGKLRSAGRATHIAEIKIVDVEGREVPRETVGEVAVRGPGVMRGYWKLPEQTAAAKRDGWMHTGDGGYMDHDGFIFIVDRLKDMIISGGENVYSAEVENALSQHPAVAVSAVIGIPDDAWGEAVHAVVVLKPNQTASAAELIAHCRNLIASYKCPRSVEFRDALPLSGAGKILKTSLREPFWKDRDRQVG